jgi:hypothetical protein
MESSGLFFKKGAGKMKYTDGSRHPRSLIIICLALIAFAAVPFLAIARTMSTSINIVNNSGREIRNVYSSHVDADDWSADLLGDTKIATGQSRAVNNLACDAQQVKVIAEDQDGCFLSVVVSCGESATWTISSDTARDCGY